MLTAKTTIIFHSFLRTVFAVNKRSAIFLLLLLTYLRILTHRKNNQGTVIASRLYLRDSPFYPINITSAVPSLPDTQPAAALPY